MSLDQLKAVATEGKSLKPVERIKLKVEGIQAQLAKAIPVTMQKTFTPERLTRLFWQEVRRIKHLDECTPESIATGLMTAAQLGIEIGVVGQGWLIPFFNKHKKTYEAQFIIGYKGLIGLARRSGEVTSVMTQIVYENDEFSILFDATSESPFRHVPFMNGDRGAIKAVWGLAKLPGNGYHFEWMPIADVEKIRARSRSKDDGPWMTDYEQMVRKTIIRRMANYLPLSIECSNAVALDQAIDEGKKASIDGEFVEIEEDQDEPPQLEHKPAEQIPEQTKKREKVTANKQEITPSQGVYVYDGPPLEVRWTDKETGEILAKNKPGEIVPDVTAEQLLNRFAVTKDADVLDADATLIGTIKDEEMRKDLTAYYMKRRGELKS